MTYGVIDSNKPTKKTFLGELEEHNKTDGFCVSSWISLNDYIEKILGFSQQFQKTVHESDAVLNEHVLALQTSMNRNQANATAPLNFYSYNIYHNDTSAIYVQLLNMKKTFSGINLEILQQLIIAFKTCNNYLIEARSSTSFYKNTSEARELPDSMKPVSWDLFKPGCSNKSDTQKQTAPCCSIQ